MTGLSVIEKHLGEIESKMIGAVEKRDQEIKDLGEARDKTAAQIEKLEKSLLDAAEELKAKENRITELEKKSQRGYGSGGDVERKTLGQAFIEEKGYKEGTGTNRFATIERKNLTSASNSAGVLVQPYIRGLIPTPDQPLFIRDFLPEIPVDSNSVKIYRETFTNNAGYQATEFDLKNQSALAYTEQNVNIETLAHWIPASRQILDDARLLAARIDNRLVYGLNQKIDQEIMYGAGGANALNGIMTDAEVQTATAQANDTYIDVIRRAVTKCQIANYININGVVVNPMDWETIELTKGTDNRYLWVTVPDGGVSRLWRVPVIVSNAIQKGEFVLGDWNVGAAVYARSAIEVRTAEQHADFFVKNGIVMLAEERLGLGIEAPLAFCKGEFPTA